MRFVLPLAALLFVAGPALAARQSDVTPDAGTPAVAPASALRFAWPVPSRVTVTERILKKGKRAVMRYDAVLSARKEGGYELKLDKFQFLEREGQDLTKGPLPPGIKEATAMASAIPTLVLSAEGELVDMVGVEEMLERIYKMMPEERREQMRAVFERPGMKEMFKQSGGEFWNAWVGAWVGLKLAAGEEGLVTGQSQLPSGPVESVVTVRHRGPDAEHQGAVRLELESVLEGEPFRKTVVATMTQLFQGATPPGKEPPDVDAMVKSARRVSRAEVVMDSATMRPYSARRYDVSKVVVGDKESETIEEHEYSFAWPAPKKAGKRR
ncbi:hypothetical protein NR798_39695 [Archangium gephyra]|uniref:hypothetical protein n=1 Tax=Archangium gephyra TaxID=48 RepID=UPI0035D453E3